MQQPTQYLATFTRPPVFNPLNQLTVNLRVFIILALLCPVAGKAQSLRGRITDSARAPVPFIPLALLDAKDSAVVKGTSTDEAGIFRFEPVKPGRYLLKIEAVGYTVAYTPVYTVDSLSEIDVATLVLISAAVNLSEVSVTAVKKLVEYKNGNITVNVENSPLAVGNSLYELLARLPTVTLTDDVISIQGKAGARILMDDRLQQLSGQQLINFLKSIQASGIEKIEILKNPPAKYDAAGTGFISVKTKKLKVTGFSGSANLSYRQGFYGDKDGGISLDYKGRSFAVFSYLNAGDNAMRYTSLFNKSVTYNGSSTDFNQATREKNSTRYASYMLGADWYLNSRNTIGFRIEGNKGEARPRRTGENNLSDGSQGYNQLVFGSLRPNAWDYVNYNVNAEHRFDTAGTLLRLSADFSPNQDLNKGDFENHFLDPAGNSTLPSRIFKSDNNLQFTLYSGKIDFEKQLGKLAKLEMGVKGNDQSMTTRFNFNNKDPLTGAYTIDTTFTNGFTYREQIYAGYLNLSKDFKKFNFQLGLRGENTHVNAGSINGDISFTRDYFNLFPMFSANYNPSPKHSYQLSYNKRISRPNYTSFNPYKYFVNLLVSFQGNPYLMPEYYHNIEFTHGFRSAFYNTASFSVVNNIMYGYPLQNDSTKETLQKTANLTRCYMYSYSIYLQNELTKWWVLSLNGSASYITGYGQVEGRYYSATSLQANIYINNQFILPKAFRAELSFFYVAPNQVVIYKNGGRMLVDAAIRKGFMNNRLNLSIGVNDIFYSWVTRNTVNYLNIRSNLESTFDTRRFKAGLTYNFGKVKVQQRQNKSQDEKKRLDH